VYATGITQQAQSGKLPRRSFLFHFYVVLKYLFEFQLCGGKAIISAKLSILKYACTVGLRISVSKFILKPIQVN